MDTIDKVTKFIILEEHIFEEDEGNTATDSIKKTIDLYDKYYSYEKYIMFKKNLLKSIENEFTNINDIEKYNSEYDY